MKTSKKHLHLRVPLKAYWSFFIFKDYLVVVHDSVQRLDPHRINVSVKYDPFRTVIVD